jgi:hypothetical protein
MRIALALVLAGAVGGCIGPAPYMAGADGRGLAVKPVAAKESPATLIARDGTSCTVTHRRFEAISVGDRVACYWGNGESLPPRER